MLTRVHVVTVLQEGKVGGQAVFYSQTEAIAAYRKAVHEHGEDNTLLNHHTPVQLRSGIKGAAAEIFKRVALMRKALLQLANLEKKR